MTKIYSKKTGRRIKIDHLCSAHPMFVAKTLVQVADELLGDAILRGRPDTEQNEKALALVIQKIKYQTQCN